MKVIRLATVRAIYYYWAIRYSERRMPATLGRVKN